MHIPLPHLERRRIHKRQRRSWPACRLRMVSLRLVWMAAFILGIGASPTIRATEDYLFLTWAGLSQSPGTVDATGGAARFDWPRGVAMDKAGNLYVADSGNETIRRIGLNGEVTTLAGLAGSCGAADGIGASASFNWPRGLAVDGEGNVYVADTWNHVIRRVSPVGEVTTVAGLAGHAGSVDGKTSAARFHWPRSVAVDKLGNVFVADSWNATIRKISVAGDVTTLAGLAGCAGSAD